MGKSALIHQNPIIFTPDAAAIIGLNAAIVIQKLQFLLDLPDSGREVDGHHWIYNTYPEWREKYFKFWSEDTIERTFLALEKAGLVASIQPEGRESRRKYYRVSEAGYFMLNTKNLPDHRNLPPSDSDDRNLLLSEDRNLPPSCAGASNLSENTQRIHAHGLKRSPVCDEKDASEIYDAYPRKVSRKDAIKSIKAMLRKYDKEFLLKATQAFASKIATDKTDIKYVPYPATWFNREEFDSQAEVAAPSPEFGFTPEEQQFEEPQKTMAEMLEERRQILEARGE